MAVSRDFLMLWMYPYQEASNQDFNRHLKPAKVCCDVREQPVVAEEQPSKEVVLLHFSIF
jgi:hypothetical protein